MVSVIGVKCYLKLIGLKLKGWGRDGWVVWKLSVVFRGKGNVLI